MVRKLVLGLGLAAVAGSAVGCTASSSATTTPVQPDEYKKRMENMQKNRGEDYKDKTGAKPEGTNR